MKCSEAIKKLQEIIDTDGDLPLYISQVDYENGLDLSKVKSIETVVNGETKPFLVRIIDWID